MTRGEIYYCHLPFVDEHLQKNERPVIIMSEDEHAPTATVIPITSVLKRLDINTHVLLRTPLKRESMAIVEQITTVNKDGISNKLCDAAKDDMRRIIDAVCVYLGVIG